MQKHETGSSLYLLILFDLVFYITQTYLWNHQVYNFHCRKIMTKILATTNTLNANTLILKIYFMHQYILFQIFHNLSVFIFYRYFCYAITVRKPSHKAIWLKFRPSITKFLRNLIISIYEKVRLEQLWKAKVFNINLNIAHFWKCFSYRASYSACTILCKSHDFLISWFKSELIFQKMCLFGTFIS